MSTNTSFLTYRKIGSKKYWNYSIRKFIVGRVPVIVSQPIDFRKAKNGLLEKEEISLYPDGKL